MKNLLVVESSARRTRSLSRHLVAHAVAAFSDRCADARITVRDVGAQPVPPLDEPWIAAAFTPPEHRTARDAAALAASERLVDELLAADAVVIGAPIYNFGVAAQLKAWIDQIVRIGRTFAFDGAAVNPYTPLLRGQPVLVATAAGSSEMFPGGAMAASNFLEPQLAAVCGFVGLGAPQFVRIGGGEAPGADLAAPLRAAERAIDEAIDGWFAQATA